MSSFDPEASLFLCKKVADACDSVSIKPAAIAAYAALLDVVELKGKAITSEPATEGNGPVRLAHTLAMSAINFCYFPELGVRPCPRL